MKEISRREFLKLVGGVIGAEFFRPIESFLPPEPQPKTLPFEEILKRCPQINPKITAVNLSCIPERFVGQNIGFHHPQESLVMTVPYNDIKKGKLEIYGYAPGLKEAIKRGQKVVLVVENPAEPAQYDSQSWTKGVEKVAEYFKGASIFIIGNEINTHYSPWRHPLDKYQELYLTAYQKIKTISPKSSVFPWQEAYYGEGEVLQEFLAGEKVKGKIDGLAFNFYDISSKIEGKVDLYHRILSQFGLSQLPVMIGELGKPINNYLSQEQQARLVVQNLATAAYFEKRGQIDLSAWYCAYAGPNGGHALSFSTDKEFKPKPGLFAFLLAQRLLRGDINLIKHQSGLMELIVTNQGRTQAHFVWNEGERKITLPPKAGCCQVWTPSGRELSSDSPLVLYPSYKPSVYPGGTAVFVF